MPTIHTLLYLMRDNLRLQVIGMLCIVCIVLLGFFFFTGVFQKETDFNAYATTIIAACADAEYRPTCYDKQIPELLNELSLSNVFEVIGIVQERDQVYGYCHLLGHELGEREVAKDPARWMHVVTKCPANGMCANGCLHGALIERFSQGEDGLTDAQIEEAKPDLAIACEPREGWDPTPLDKAICYHGLGHMTIYITQADVRKSLDICDDIAEKADARDYTNLCYGGLFMQIYQPLEPEDEALVADININQDNFADYCNSFETEKRRQSCFVQGWPVFREAVRTPEGMLSFCRQSDNESIQAACLKGLFHTVGQGANFEADAIHETCREMPGALMGQCYGDAARSMIQADPRFATRANGLCNSITSDSVKDTCYGAIVEYADYRFHRDSDAFIALCEAMPTPWQGQCLEKRN